LSVTLLTKIKQILKKTFVFKMMIWLRRKFASLEQIKLESRSNAYHFSPVHEVIRSIASQHSVKVFFETGTYLGNTVFGVKNAFEKVYSVELSKELAELARERFAGDLHVEIMNDDSSQALRSFLGKLSEPAVFWLDAHYSAGITAMGQLQTPVRDELEAILAHPMKKHHILIDDVKDFNGENDYPTVAEVIEMVRQFGHGQYAARIEGDVFRIYPLMAPGFNDLSRSVQYEPNQPA